MDFKGFVRECYLRSVPSVDLEKVTEIVDCREHRLSLAEYDNILRDFDVKEGTKERFACNMWVLQSGPQLY